jgi:hypothetical protein
MARRTTTGDTRTDSIYQVEHWGAWALVVAALALGFIGMMRGLGVFTGAGLATELPGVDAETVAPAEGANFFIDGMVWLIAALATGVLAMALHRNGHHRMMSPEYARDRDESLWKAEHWAAWLFALGAIAFVAIGLLVAYDVFDRGNTWQDGMVWIVAGLGLSLVTTALHAVRHHQLATDEDYIVAIVEQRVGPATATRTTAPAPERRTEPRP